MHFLHSLYENIKYLAIGGLVTSLAEFLFGYNLIDFAKDKLAALIGAKKAA